jgi:5-methylcytosine-specific restriction enzyme A
VVWSKESRQARGYGRAWDLLRVQILKRDHGLCQCDRCKGGEIRILPGTEVNHIVSKAEAERLGWTQEQMDDPSNLQAVNPTCHKRITAEQKGYKLRPTIGPDGWPHQA